MAASTETAIGIDLGTTYSCVAVYQKGKVEVLSNDHSEHTTPSYVAFTEHERLIGVEAKAMVGEDPRNTVFDAKRMIGRKYNDATITADMPNWPFKVINSRGNPQIEVTYKKQLKLFTPEEISSMVLVRMKEMAEQYLGEQVTNAVITVPAYFNDSQRKATKAAAQIAGLNVLRLTNEPIAAAIAFGFNKRGERPKNVLVYDLGGGTFDVCIVEIDDGVFDTKTVRGNTHLGGQDFDMRMVNYFVQEFKAKHKIDLSNDQKAKHKLRSKCEIAKRSLSTKQEARVEIDSISNGIDFQSVITRARFEELCDDLFQETLIPVQEALQHAGMTVADIDEIVLVGGSTKIPKLRQIMEDFFVGKKLNKTVNPDEAVAVGAAIQAASLGNSDKDEMLAKMQVNIVQPLTLGTDLRSGLVSEMIKRDTKLPAKMKKTFVTTYDDQTCMTIQVLEGERGTIAECTNLGVFTYDGIPAAPAGQKFVEVTFEVDLNGHLSVTAFEKSSNRRENWITPVGPLSQEEIDEKILVAELFKAEDEKEKQRLVARNNLEHSIFSLKNKLKSQFGSNLQQSDKEFAEAKIEGTVLWLDSNNSAPKERFEEKQQELTDLMKTLVLQQPSSSRI